MILIKGKRFEINGRKSIKKGTNEDSVGEPYVFLKYTGPHQQSAPATQGKTQQLRNLTWVSRNAVDINNTDAAHRATKKKADQCSRLAPDPFLANRKVLPEFVGPLPKDLYGIPLEEIDKNIMDEPFMELFDDEEEIGSVLNPQKYTAKNRDKTFVVIEKRFKKNIIHRFSAKRSLFLFSPRNPIRRLSVCIATNVCFDYFLMFTIVINCVFLAMPNIPEFVEYIFLGIYTMEMAIKLVARGFFIDKYTYLRDAWNCLDFTVIMISYITLLLQTINDKVISDITGLRTFRVLRALRTLSIIPGLKTMVNALLRALRMLISVLILILFCLWIFSQAGVQLFGGALRHKCVLQIHGSPAFGKTYDEFYAEHIENSDNWLAKSNGDYVLCGNATGAGSCPSNYSCLPDIGENPNYGYTNFDNIGWSMLISFQLLTQDYWEDVYNKVIRAHSPWTVIYFIVINFFGSLYLMNLMLAVVASAYELEVKNTGKATAREQKQERRGTLTVSEAGSQVDERNCSCCEQCCGCCYNPWLRVQNFAHYIITDSFTEVFIIFIIVLNTVFLAMEHHGMSMELKNVLKVANYVFTTVFVAEALLKLVAFNKQYFKSGWNIFDLVVVVASLIDLGVEGLKGVSVFRSFRLLRVFRLAQSWTTMRLLLCIILNTLGSLGYLTIILIIIIYIFAVTGLQLFHTEYTTDKFGGEPVPRWNFNDFLHSFMMVFRILCGEWIEPMYDCMRACNGLCFLIFIPVTVFGKTLFFLFIGLVLGAFGSDTVEQEVEVSSFALAWQRIQGMLGQRKGNICPTDDNVKDDGQDEAGLDVLQHNINVNDPMDGQYRDLSSTISKGKNSKISCDDHLSKQAKSGKLYYSLPDVVAVTKKARFQIGPSPSLPNMRSLEKDGSGTLKRKGSETCRQSCDRGLPESFRGFATLRIKNPPYGESAISEDLSNKISKQCKAGKSFHSLPDVEMIGSKVHQKKGKLSTSLMDIRTRNIPPLADSLSPESNFDKDIEKNKEKGDRTPSGKYVTFSNPFIEVEVKSSDSSLLEDPNVTKKSTSVELKHGVLPNSETHVECCVSKESVPAKCEKLSNSLLAQITSSQYWKPQLLKQLFNPPIFIESSTDPIPLDANCKMIPNLPEIVESLQKQQKKKPKQVNSCGITEQALKDMKYKNLLNIYTDEDIASELRSQEKQSSSSEKAVSSMDHMKTFGEEASILKSYGTPVDLLVLQSKEKTPLQQQCGKSVPLITTTEIPDISSSSHDFSVKSPVSTNDTSIYLDRAKLSQEITKSSDFRIAFKNTTADTSQLPVPQPQQTPSSDSDISVELECQRKISMQHNIMRKLSSSNIDEENKILQQQLLQQQLQKCASPQSYAAVMNDKDTSTDFPYVEEVITWQQQQQPQQMRFRKSSLCVNNSSETETLQLPCRKQSSLAPVAEIESDETSELSEKSLSPTAQLGSPNEIQSLQRKISSSSMITTPTNISAGEATSGNRKSSTQSVQSMSSFLANMESVSKKCSPPYGSNRKYSRASFADVVLASSTKLRNEKMRILSSTSLIDEDQGVSNRIFEQQTCYGTNSLSDMKGTRTKIRPRYRNMSLLSLADVGRSSDKFKLKSEARRYSSSMSDVKNLKSITPSSSKGSTKSLSRMSSVIMKVQQNSEETKIDLRNNDKQSKDGMILENNCNNDSLASLGSLGSIPDIMDGSSVEDDISSCQQKDIQPCLPLFISSRFKCLREFDDTTHGKKWNNFRRQLMMVCENKFFETGVLVIIFASSILLAFEDIYLNEKPRLKLAIFYLDITFCLLFFLEMVLKLVALGFVHYYTHFWTILDFTIVIITVISLAASGLGMEQITAFRSLRTLRALRPLRAVSRWQGMKIIVNALMLSIPSIFNVLLVCVVFWLIFAIMGVQLFAGKFYKCVNETNMRMPPTEVANKIECYTKNYTWVNSKVNFDNVGGAFLALFQVATFEGWMEIMADAVDVTEVDEQPKFEASVYYYFYFVLFIIFGSFFVLNLVIGVIIDKFSFLKKKYDGTYLDMFLTPTQQNYYNTLKKLGTKKPQKTVKRPKNKCQAVVYDLVMSNQFEIFVTTIIITNMIFMAFEHYNQSKVVTEVLATANIAFTILYAAEAIIKIIGLRIHYLRNLWNVFDFLVVSLSVIDAFLNDVFGDGMFMNPSLLRVARMFRIGRIIRLIKWAKGMRKLLFALVISLPALFNIGALLMLVMFIYTIIGMSSFGQIKLSGALNDQVNFQTFGKTFLLLVRLATSAGWNDILGPLLIQPPNCDPTFITTSTGQKIKQVNGDCGMPWLAISYMVSYIIIVFMIVFNMYIAVILENFNQAHAQEEVGITEDDLDMFYGVWEQYDPLATQFIKHEQLSDFIQDLDPPLKVKKPNNVAIATFDLPIVKGGHIHCLDILLALVKFALGGNLEETEAFKRVRTQMEAKFDKIFPTREKSEIRTSTLQMRREEMAARTLQRAWKRRKIMQSFPSPEMIRYFIISAPETAV